MDFLRELEVPRRASDRVFRFSANGGGYWSLIVVGLAFLGIGLAGGIHAGEFRLPSFIAYWIAGVLGVFVLAYRPIYRAAGLPSNWLVIHRPGELIVKFRSYQNHHFDRNDLVAVRLKAGEIRGVRSAEQWRETLDHDSDRVKVKEVYLYLQLAEEPPEDLERLIREERLRKGPETGRWVRGRTTYRHYPVDLLPGGLLRLNWAGVVPGLKEAETVLGRSLSVLPSGVPADLPEIPRDSLEEVRDMAMRGETIGAASLARRILGCSLAEAYDVVDQLLKQPNKPI